jgi:glutathione S-transferase
MVQLVALNELLPAVVKLLMDDKSASAPSSDLEYAQLRAINPLSFLEDLLGDRLYFAGEQLTLAEIVAGTLVDKLPNLGVEQIQLSADEWDSFKRRIRVMPRTWERRRRQRLNAIQP